MFEEKQTFGCKEAEKTCRELAYQHNGDQQHSQNVKNNEPLMKTAWLGPDKEVAARRGHINCPQAQSAYYMPPAARVDSCLNRQQQEQAAARRDSCKNR